MAMMTQVVMGMGWQIERELGPDTEAEEPGGAAENSEDGEKDYHGQSMPSLLDK